MLTIVRRTFMNYPWWSLDQIKDIIKEMDLKMLSGRPGLRVTMWRDVMSQYVIDKRNFIADLKPTAGYQRKT